MISGSLCGMIQREEKYKRKLKLCASPWAYGFSVCFTFFVYGCAWSPRSCRVSSLQQQSRQLIWSSALAHAGQLLVTAGPRSVSPEELQWGLVERPSEALLRAPGITCTYPASHCGGGRDRVDTLDTSWTAHKRTANARENAKQPQNAQTQQDWLLQKHKQPLNWYLWAWLYLRTQTCESMWYYTNLHKGTPKGTHSRPVRSTGCGWCNGVMV